METPSKQGVPNSQPLTTFVQVDTTKFKEVVQRLTGSSKETPDTIHEASCFKGNFSIRKPAFKLHERRQYKAKLEIIKPPSNFKEGIQSSPLSTPTKCFSGLSLGENESELNREEEERAIKERRFYLHPSPRSRMKVNEPELLTLFPLKSPKIGKDE